MKRLPQFAMIVMCFLAGCSAMPHNEGPRARLLPGCEKPRDRNNMDLTIYRPPIVAHFQCIHEALSTGYVKDGIMMAGLSLIGGVVIECANVPTDEEVRQSGAERPWCTVIAPAGSDYWLEHGLRHCECWDHPATSESAEAMVTDRDQNKGQ